MRARGIVLVPVLMAVGCGGGGGGDAMQMPDAPGGGGGDAVAGGMASVTIGYLTVSAAGVAVSFADPDGTPATLATTDANGTASAAIAPGSSATIVVPASGDEQAELITVLDLQPGDAIAVVRPNDASVGMASVTVGARASATHYVASDGCVNATPIVPATATAMQVGPYCEHAQKFAVLAYATGDDLRPIAYQQTFDITAPAAGATATVASGTWRTDFASYPLVVSHPAAGTASVDAFVGPYQGAVGYLIDDLTLPVAGGGGGDLAFALKTPTSASWTGYGYVVQTASTSGRACQRITGVTTTATPPSIDLATTLPYLHNLALDMVGGQTSPTVHFAADGDLQTASGTIAFFHYMGATDVVLQTAVIAGPAPLARTMPHLPDALAAYRPAVPLSGDMSGVSVFRSARPDAKSFRETWAASEYAISEATMPDVPVEETGAQPAN